MILKLWIFRLFKYWIWFIYSSYWWTKSWRFSLTRCWSSCGFTNSNRCTNSSYISRCNSFLSYPLFRSKSWRYSRTTKLIKIYVKYPGVFYGQCSEICGANHSFMPIVLEAIVRCVRMKQLHSLHKRAIKSLMLIPNMGYIQKYCALKLLPQDKNVLLKQCVLMQKVVHGKAPEYLKDFMIPSERSPSWDFFLNAQNKVWYLLNKFHHLGLFSME